MSATSLKWCVVAVSCALCACPRVGPPDIAVHYNTQCVEALNAQQFDQADAFCDHALEFDETYWDALHNKGLIALLRGNRDAARSFFIRAIRANQAMAQSYNDLCSMALDDQDFVNARDKCLAALRINPNYNEARHNLGLAYLRLNRLDDAEKAFRHMLISGAFLSQSYANLGSVMLLKRRPADALPLFEQALTLEAHYADAWKGAAWAHRSLGHRAEAREAFESCLEANPGDVECQYGLRELGP